MKVLKDTAASEHFQASDAMVGLKAGDRIAFYDDAGEKQGSSETVKLVGPPTSVFLTHARTLTAGWEVKPITE